MQELQPQFTPAHDPRWRVPKISLHSRKEPSTQLTAGFDLQKGGALLKGVFFACDLNGKTDCQNR